MRACSLVRVQGEIGEWFLKTNDNFPVKLFQRFFGRTSKPDEPDNSRLLELMDIYWKTEGKGNTYENVVLELMNGNSFLIVPGQNGLGGDSRGWTATKMKTTLRLTSVYTLGGLKVLAAFTDEKALLDWSKQACPYTSLRSQAVLEFCDWEFPRNR